MVLSLPCIHQILVLVCCLLQLTRIKLTPARFRHHHEYIREIYEEHDRLGPRSQAHTVTAHIQPVPAFIGLVGSLLIVFVFTSATWWKQKANFRKVAVAYGAPVILLLIFLTLKAISRRGYVKLDATDSTQLIDAIEILKTPKGERDEREPRRYRRWFLKSRKRSTSGSQADGEAIPMDNAPPDGSTRRHHISQPDGDTLNGSA